MEDTVTVQDPPPAWATPTEKPQVARSPEAFPALALYPDGWDLESPRPNGKRPAGVKSVAEMRMPAFPGTTDAYI